MNDFSKRVELMDESPAMTALERARERWAAQNMQMEFDSCVGTCQTCGAYWDTRYFERCPSPSSIDETQACGGYIG